ncbi:MAG: CapA family protein [Oscillospiraceae bacterium]|jgi:poly-gamma-glutamate synthesis protein (capsule biosynthesis protein)|nr:CapA family protein [Oscillospiraceae bacterium]
MDKLIKRFTAALAILILLTAIPAYATDGFESMDDPEEHISTSTEEIFNADEIRIVMTFGGDVTLGGTDDQRKSQLGFDAVVAEQGYDWPFSAITNVLADDDLTLVNFEGALTESNKKTEKEFNFKGPADYAFMLTGASVEAVNLANNHIMDYGAQGKQDTMDALDDAGVVYCAAGQTAITEVNGVTVGLIGNTFPYASGRRDISKDVRDLRAKGCQIIVASFHWGSEYEKAFGRDQRNIGRAAIDAGADIVVGHHPHIIQGIEIYKDKYILYSLGNLVFGGNRDPEDRDSFLARVTFTMNDMSGAVKSTEFEMIPLRVTELSTDTDYRPVVAEGSAAERIRDRVLNLSYNVDRIMIH